MKKALIATALLFGCTGQVLAVGSVADVTVYDRAESRTLPVHYHEDRYSMSYASRAGWRRRKRALPRSSSGTPTIRCRHL